MLRSGFRHCGRLFRWWQIPSVHQTCRKRERLAVVGIAASAMHSVTMVMLLHYTLHSVWSKQSKQPYAASLSYADGC
jgi:hypothetical protein